MRLLAKWNQAYNLTAVRDPAQMIPRHLLDSLAALPYVQGPRVLDVGSGAGLPGIPLALARPDWQLTVLDSNSKKTRFLTQAKAELKLTGFEVVHARVEDFRPPEGFDTVITRAVGRMSAVLAGCRPLIRPGGRFVALKGEYPADELAELKDYAPADTRTEVARLSVPGLKAERHVVVLSPGAA